MSEEEIRIKQYWTELLSYLKNDMAYMWSDEVQTDFNKIETSVTRIRFILNKLRSWYQHIRSWNPQLEILFEEELRNIELLLAYLNSVQPSKKFLEEVNGELNEVMRGIKPLEIMADTNLKLVLTDRYILDIIKTWLVLEGVNKQFGDDKLTKLFGKTPAKELLMQKSIYQFLLSFIEGIIDAEDVVPYLRAFLYQCKNHGLLIDICTFLLHLSNQELIVSLQRQKSKIAELILSH